MTPRERDDLHRAIRRRLLSGESSSEIAAQIELAHGMTDRAAMGMVQRVASQIRRDPTILVDPHALIEAHAQIAADAFASGQLKVQSRSLREIERIRERMIPTPTPAAVVRSKEGIIDYLCGIAERLERGELTTSVANAAILAASNALRSGQMRDSLDEPEALVAVDTTAGTLRDVSRAVLAQLDRYEES